MIYLALSRPASLAVAAPIVGPLVCFARDRVVDQPAARSPARQADRRSDHFPAESFAQNLGILRDLRRPGRSLAAAGQLSGASRAASSLIARRRPTWDLRCSPICPPTTSVTFPPAQLIERTANTLHTMEALERYRGHFYNWYDTQSLQPLPPLYISTVDSGNLAGHLLTLRAGLLALPDRQDSGTAIVRRARRHAADSGRGRRRSLSGPIPRNSSMNLESPAGHASRPRGLCLERLAASASELVDQPRCWLCGAKRQVVGRCASPGNARDALDELALRPRGNAEIGEIPTLRELARLELELPAASQRAAST